jgi:DNA mismatch endonuclease (patch repair protein)
MATMPTPVQREINVSRILSRDTKPEMLTRSKLHARGLRHRLHDRTLLSRPDLVFPEFRAAAFIP